MVIFIVIFQVPQLPHADVPQPGAVQLRGAGRQQRVLRCGRTRRLRDILVVYQVWETVRCEHILISCVNHTQVIPTIWAKNANQTL